MELKIILLFSITIHLLEDHLKLQQIISLVNKEAYHQLAIIIKINLAINQLLLNQFKRKMKLKSRKIILWLTKGLPRKKGKMKIKVIENLPLKDKS